ncbi:hypothetical protein K4K58_002090 [Colletotrichum sp. SAR11_239]|nr:hypothetical protein K4K58_002090 [Colletotrichum sp. SAR11_239]
MSDPLQYTIGWICAFTTESVAARAFLDERHEQPKTVAQNDNNAYTLGRFGIHNVVIAARPKSEYGTAPAIVVALDMLESFPNIRLCLMVGIGGGAPSENHDIRLGDIVAGSSVFKSDFDFVQRDSLNQPPALLFIRGICDYADSHKSKEWQGYAAMAAAAFAKDLLHHIPLGQVEKQNRIKDVLNNGTGKTVLGAMILDHASQTNNHIALDFFFEFNDRRKNHIDDMLRSLAFQLYMQSEPSRKVLDELFASHDNGRRQVETEKVSEYFHAMLQVSGKVYIVLDALDECANMTELLEWIRGLVSNTQLHSIQLFAISRPEEELKRGIRKCIGEQNCVSFDYSFLNEDIGAYISSRLEQSQTFQTWASTPEILEKIRYEVEQNADGMFRLAACQLDDLEQSLTLDELTSRLEDLPRDLYAMYDRMILNFPPEIKRDALRLLQFLIHAERPVTITEAVDHISTQAEDGQVDVHGRRLVHEDIMYFCPGLMSTTEESRDGKITKVIQLAHITVKEYLMCRSEFQLPSATARVAFTESYGSSSVASQMFSEEAISTKPSSLDENINVTEDHATRQMAKTFYSHKQIESSCDDTSDDIRSLISGIEDIQSQDGSNSTRWEVREAAANYLADMLTKDPNLGPLYEEAFKSLDDARFTKVP